MARSDGAMGVTSLCGIMLMTMIMAAAAQAPSPSGNCQDEVLKMADCLEFVTGTNKTPSKACCSELSTVVNEAPQCLCLLFNTSFTEQLGVNVTIAQQLPAVCKVQTPPPSLCSALGVPVPGPVAGPVTLPAPTSPANSPAPSTPAESPAPTTAPTPGAQAPAPSGNCQDEVLKMVDCLEFVTGGTNKTPSKACCSELSTVVNEAPQCLCLLFNTSFTEQVGVNVTIAQQLPTACKVQTPPPSLCSALGVPVPGPVGGPVASMTPVNSPPSAMAPGAGSTNLTTQPSITISPNSAPRITSRNGAVAASLLFLAGIFVS